MSETPRTLSRHPRSLGENRYVYAVLSRRARGISVGINLNPDKICNFDCIYCQVDRTTPPLFRNVDEGTLLEELESVLRRAHDGSLFREFRFDGASGLSERLSDIAFAGDGEPTTYPRFRELLGDVIALKKRLGLEETKISLLTNCTVERSGRSSTPARKRTTRRSAFPGARNSRRFSPISSRPPESARW